MKRFLGWVVSVATVAVLHMTPAHAVAVVSGPGAAITGYATPAAIAHAGMSLQYLNADSDIHNVVSNAYGSDTNPWCATHGYAKGKCPLFRSEDFGLGQYGEVAGVAALRAGSSYGFFCSYHATSMKGTLQVQ